MSTGTVFKVRPDVYAVETDVSMLRITNPVLLMLIGDAEKGRAGPVWYYGPSIPPIRWWQF